MGEGTTQKKPIVYQDQIEVRFSELDPYGHLNAQHYVDYVLTSRWSFLRKRFQMTAQDFVKKGLGFFLNHFSIDYYRPVLEGQTVTIRSHAIELKSEKVVIEFNISNPSLDALFARGKLELTSINLATLRPQTLPDWAAAFLFES